MLDLQFKKKPISGPPYVLRFGEASDSPAVCFGEWVPTPGKSLRVDILRHSDWVYTPGLQLLVDVDCETFEKCINDWVSQPGDALELEFDCCSNPCTNDWVDVAGNALVLDATADAACDQDWRPVTGTGLEFDFECCGPSWSPTPGNAVDIDFLCPGKDIVLDVPACDSNCYGNWYPQPGNDLDLEYVCCDGSDDGGTGEEVILGQIGLYEGSTLELNVTTRPQFAPQFGYGEDAVVALTVPAAHRLEAAAANGETAEIALSTRMVLQPDFVDGVSVEAVLSTRPAIEIGAVDLYTGETLVVTPQFSTTLPVDWQFGEQFVADITAAPYEGPQPIGAHGEELTVALTTITGFQAPAFDGQTAVVDLAVTQLFAFTASTGEEFRVDLAIAPPADIAVVFGDGATVTANLSLGASGFGIIQLHDGSEATVDLAIRVQPDIAVGVVHGETASIALSLAANLGTIGFSHGERGEFDLGEDPNIVAYHGQAFEASLATSDSLVASMYSGTTAEFALTTGPSEPIGNFVFYEGQSSNAVVAVLRAIPLEVVFYNSTTTHAGIVATTFFDLDVSCGTNHNPGQQDIHRIELNDSEYPDQRFDGDRICVTMDLRTQPRFQFNFFSGERFDNVDVNPYLPTTRAAYGTAARFELESRYDVPLCPGNFIPDGDNVYVELDVLDDTRCTSDYAYEGAAMAIGSLQAFPNFKLEATDGSRMDFDLTIDPLWRLDFHTGETLRMADNPEFTFIPTYGTVMELVFYAPPIVAADGSAMTADLVIKYDVKFDELGCLENEYIYQNENGDPIPELFNPVGVELEPYQHDIRAHCE